MNECNRAEIDYSKPDPYRVFKVLGELIGEQEGIKVTLKSVTKKEKKQTA